MLPAVALSKSRNNTAEPEMAEMVKKTNWHGITVEPGMVWVSDTDTFLHTF